MPLSWALILSLVGSITADLSLTEYNTTAFGGPVAAASRPANIAGPSELRCNQSAEYIGSLTVPLNASNIAFSAEVDSDVSTLRVWVAEFLVLDADTGSDAQRGPHTAKLWRNTRRGDVVFCASKQCDTTQRASGYDILSADQGHVCSMDSASNHKPLYFSWSASNLDNWVTSSRDCPGAAYQSCGNPDGFIYSKGAPGRLEVTAFRTVNNSHHMTAATSDMKNWALNNGYVKYGPPLGWLDAPGSTCSAEAPRKNVSGLVALPANILAESPLPLRVHYARKCSGLAQSGFLSLLWNVDDSSVMSVVPANLLSPKLTHAQEAREAMRARLYEPVVPWQTYVHTSMGAHSLQPTGLVLRLGLADIRDDESIELLGDSGNIKPWSRFVPAHCRPGRHSLNGSDYTSFEISGWGDTRNGHKSKPVARRNATVQFETTTLNAHGGACSVSSERCDLLALVSCQGSDCNGLALTVSGSFEWGRVGDVTFPATANGPQVQFSAPGFPDVSAFSCTECLQIETSNNKHSVQRPMRFIKITEDGGKTGMSTGKRRSLAEIRSAIQAAGMRANTVPARLSNVSDLALPLFDVLAWNTLYTTSLHVYTPVSRTFGDSSHDDAATTFVWDVFFAAVMFGIAGPDHASTTRARDIAYANIITTVFSRTVTGMVPNYRTGAGGQTCTYDRTEPMVGTWSLEILHSVFGDDWPVELLFPALFEWNTWVWQRRRSEGMLGKSHSSGQAPLISLGSDGPPACSTGVEHTTHTLGRTV